MTLNICIYKKQLDNAVIIFLEKAFIKDGRQLILSAKDTDLQDIDASYMQTGCFWCLKDEQERIYGTIALRKLSDCWEIRRFFIHSKFQGKGYGTQLLNTALHYAAQHDIRLIKAATMERGKIAYSIFTKAGFVPTTRYNNSSGEIFLKLEVTAKLQYKLLLSNLKRQFEESLILNPTENLPMYDDSLDTTFIDGLYVSERYKDLNDKIIFAGRNNFIDFFEKIKAQWKIALKAYDVDLKTLSGLQAHMVLFMCILQPGDTVMLLPEICGGHYSTETILKSLGAQVIHMQPDCKGLCVDREKTEALIEQFHPRFIFVDRSEGLMYENFSWLKRFANSFKIFDASQYLSQILVGTYTHPFDMGFDMILSTLHKNYPGPQKGLICVSENSPIWQTYQADAKTYISSTHPGDIAASIIPLLDFKNFQQYAHINEMCCRNLEKELIKRKIPVLQLRQEVIKTMHTWILKEDGYSIYDYYLKLEQLGLYTNYRLLPYNLGYGLRIGTSAAVRSGLTGKYIPALAEIMAQAYLGEITHGLKEQTKKLIKKIKS